MLNEEKIQEMKAKYGTLLQVTLSGVTYTYRPLMRDEYKKMQQEAMDMIDPATGMVDPSMNSDYEEKLVKMCVVDPEIIELDKLKAGIIPMMAAYITEASGFNEIAEPVEL